MSLGNLRENEKKYKPEPSPAAKQRRATGSGGSSSASGGLSWGDYQKYEQDYSTFTQTGKHGDDFGNWATDSGLNAWKTIRDRAKNGAQTALVGDRFYTMDKDTYGRYDQDYAYWKKTGKHTKDFDRWADQGQLDTWKTIRNYNNGVKRGTNPSIELQSTINGLDPEVLAQVQETYRSSWKYGSTEEDAVRKLQGLPPKSKMKYYKGGSEFDQWLYSQGLPSTKSDYFQQMYDAAAADIAAKRQAAAAGGTDVELGDMTGEASDYTVTTKTGKAKGTVPQTRWNFDGQDEARKAIIADFRKDWTYGNSTEDKARKRAGRMPKSVESMYTDSETDQWYRENGLPPAALIDMYVEGWNAGAGDREKREEARSAAASAMRGTVSDPMRAIRESAVPAKPAAVQDAIEAVTGGAQAAPAEQPAAAEEDPALRYVENAAERGVRREILERQDVSKDLLDAVYGTEEGPAAPAAQAEPATAEEAAAAEAAAEAPAVEGAGKWGDLIGERWTPARAERTAEKEGVEDAMFRVGEDEAERTPIGTAEPGEAERVALGRNFGPVVRKAQAGPLRPVVQQEDPYAARPWSVDEYTWNALVDEAISERDEGHDREWVEDSDQWNDPTSQLVLDAVFGEKTAEQVEQEREAEQARQAAIAEQKAAEKARREAELAEWRAQVDQPAEEEAAIMRANLEATWASDIGLDPALLPDPEELAKRNLDNSAPSAAPDFLYSADGLPAAQLDERIANIDKYIGQLYERTPKTASEILGGKLTEGEAGATIADLEAQQAKLRAMAATARAQEAVDESAKLYAYVSQQPDWSENSAPIPYEEIGGMARNRDEKNILKAFDGLSPWSETDDARAAEVSEYGPRVDGKHVSVYYMSEGERGVFYYLARTQGMDQAMEYVDRLLPALNARSYQAAAEVAAYASEHHPVLTTLWNVTGGQLVSAGEGAMAMIGQLTGNEVVENDPRLRMTYAKQASQADIRKKIVETTGSEYWGMAYDMGVSVFENAARAYLLGGAPGGQLMSAGTMYGQVFASTMLDYVNNKQADPKTAFVAGFLHAGAEALGEMIDMGAFLSMKKELQAGKITRDLVGRYLAKNVFTEAGSEAVTSVAEKLIDYMLMQDESEIAQVWQEAYDKNKSSGDGWWAVIQTTLKDAGMDALGGAVSGFLLAGSNLVVSKMKYGTAGVRASATSYLTEGTGVDQNAAVTGSIIEQQIRESGPTMTGEERMAMMHEIQGMSELTDAQKEHFTSVIESFGELPQSMVSDGTKAAVADVKTATAEASMTKAKIRAKAESRNAKKQGQLQTKLDKVQGAAREMQAATDPQTKQAAAERVQTESAEYQTLFAQAQAEEQAARQEDALEEETANGKVLRKISELETRADSEAGHIGEQVDAIIAEQNAGAEAAAEQGVGRAGEERQEVEADRAVIEEEYNRERDALEVQADEADAAGDVEKAREIEGRIRELDEEHRQMTEELDAEEAEYGEEAGTEDEGVGAGPDRTAGRGIGSEAREADESGYPGAQQEDQGTALEQGTEEVIAQAPFTEEQAGDIRKMLEEQAQAGITIADGAITPARAVARSMQMALDTLARRTGVARTVIYDSTDKNVPYGFTWKGRTYAKNGADLLYNAGHEAAHNMPTLIDSVQYAFDSGKVSEVIYDRYKSIRKRKGIDVSDDELTKVEFACDLFGAVMADAVADDTYYLDVMRTGLGMTNTEYTALQDAVYDTLLDNPETEMTDEDMIGAVTGESDREKQLRYSNNIFGDTEGVERTKDLVAVHSLTGDELLKTFGLGGFPMPSIAVVNDQYNHDRYGDTSVVFGSDTIDPKKRKNKVYSGDAYTPVFPEIEYDVDSKVLSRVYDKIKRLRDATPYSENARNELYRLYSDADGELRRAGGLENLIVRYMENTDMMQAFLADTQGRTVEPVMKEETIPANHALDNLYAYLVDRVGKDRIAGSTAKDIREEILDVIKQFDAENETNHYRIWAQGPMYNIRYKYLSDFAENGPAQDRIRRTEDHDATQDAIKAAVDMDEYRVWLQDLTRGLVQGTGLAKPGVSIYRNDGSRKSFKQTHMPVNAENIVLSMLGENEKGGNGGLFTSSPIAAATRDYRTLDEIIADEGRLRTEVQEIYEGKKDEVAKGFEALRNKLRSKSRWTDNPFFEIDAKNNVLIEAMTKGTSPAEIRRVLDRYADTYEIPTGIEQEIYDWKQEAQQLPTEYFEAKPQRVVGLDEMKLVVLPQGKYQELRDRLAENGTPVADYDPEIEGDRLRALNDSPEGQAVKFSDNVLGREGQETGPSDALEAAVPVYDVTPNAQKQEGTQGSLLDALTEGTETDEQRRLREYNETAQRNLDRRWEQKKKDRAARERKKQRQAEAARYEAQQRMLREGTFAPQAFSEDMEARTQRKRLTESATGKAKELGDMLSALTDQFRESDRKTADPKDVLREARKLLGDDEEYTTTLSEETVARRLTELVEEYRNAKDKDAALADMYERIHQLAQDICDSRVVDMDEEYGDEDSYGLMDLLKETPIKVGPRGRKQIKDAFGSLKEFRKAVGGSSVLHIQWVDNDSQSTYEDLGGMIGGYLDEGVRQEIQDAFGGSNTIDIAELAEWVAEQRAQNAHTEPYSSLVGQEQHASDIEDMTLAIGKLITERKIRNSETYAERGARAMGAVSRDLGAMQERVNELQAEIAAIRQAGNAEAEAANSALAEANRAYREDYKRRATERETLANRNAELNAENERLARRDTENEWQHDVDYRERRKAEQRAIDAEQENALLAKENERLGARERTRKERLRKADELYQAGKTVRDYYEETRSNPDEYDHEVARQLNGIRLRNGEDVGGRINTPAFDTILERSNKYRPQKALPTSLNSPVRVFEDVAGRYSRKNTNAENARIYRDRQQLKDTYYEYGNKQMSDMTTYVAEEREKVQQAWKGHGKTTAFDSAAVQLLGEGVCDESQLKKAVTDGKVMVIDGLDGTFVFKMSGHGQNRTSQLLAFSDSHSTYVYPTTGPFGKRASKPTAIDGALIVDRDNGRTRVTDANGTVYADIAAGKGHGLNVEAVTATRDALRAYYDKAYDEINRVRVENGYAPIRKVYRYFPHIGRQETGMAGFIQFMKDANLPTSINGLTENFRPGQAWASFLQERLGAQTEYDALRGFDGYVTQAGEQIYKTPVLQRFRQLENGLRKNAGKSDTQNAVFVEWLNKYTNAFANKKAAFDREAESIFGRGIYKLTQKGASLFSGASVGGNLSSALSNMVSWMTGAARINPARTAEAAGRQILQGLSTGYNEEKGYDGFIRRIPYLNRAFGDSESIRVYGEGRAKTLQGKLLYGVFGMVDRFAKESIGRAVYDDCMRKGMSEEQAVKRTDDFLIKNFADRGVGQAAKIFGIKWLKPVSQFQLEVLNQMYHFRDIDADAYEHRLESFLKENGETDPDKIDWDKVGKKIYAGSRIPGLGAGGEEIVKKLMYLTLLSLWGTFTRWAMGRDQSWNVFGTAKDVAKAVGDIPEGERGVKSVSEAAGGALLTAAMDNLPFSSLISGNTRVPMLGGVKNVWNYGKQALKGKDLDPVDRALAGIRAATAIVPGGGQVSKIARGAAAVARGGQFNAKGTQLQYPVGSSAADWARGLAFGPSALQPEGYDYETDKLSTPKTQAWREAVAAGADPMEAYEVISGRKQPEEYTDEDYDLAAEHVMTDERGGQYDALKQLGLGREAAYNIASGKKYSGAATMANIAANVDPKISNAQFDAIAEAMGIGKDTYDPKKHGDWKKFVDAKVADRWTKIASDSKEADMLSALGY